MCWNQAVSLNTFLFSGFVLALIVYNNAYTQYKIKELNNIWIYLFFLSFILIQLVEYFLWRNIDNPRYNQLFTTFASILIFLQPIAAGMIIPNTTVRTYFVTLYTVFGFPFWLYRFMSRKMEATVSPWKHLNWNLQVFEDPQWRILLLLLWLICFLFPLFYAGKRVGALFGLITLLVVAYHYLVDGTVASIWCWVINSVMLYYAVYLLFYLPFQK
jgi:hypothetical protein